MFRLPDWACTTEMRVSEVSCWQCLLEPSSKIPTPHAPLHSYQKYGLTLVSACPIIKNKNGLSDFQFIVASRDVYPEKSDCLVLHKILAFYKKTQKNTLRRSRASKKLRSDLDLQFLPNLTTIFVWQYWWIWIFDNFSFKFLAIFSYFKRGQLLVSEDSALR